MAHLSFRRFAICSRALRTYHMILRSPRWSTIGNRLLCYAKAFDDGMAPPEIRAVVTAALLQCSLSHLNQPGAMIAVRTNNAPAMKWNSCYGHRILMSFKNSFRACMILRSLLLTVLTRSVGCPIFHQHFLFTAARRATCPDALLYSRAFIAGTIFPVSACNFLVRSPHFFK